MNIKQAFVRNFAIRLCVYLALAVLATSPALAGTFTIPAGSGTLTYTATYTSQTQECVLDGHVYYETVFQSTYSNFSFTISGTTTALNGGDSTHSAICNYNPASFPPITFYVSGFQIVFTPSGNTAGSAAVTTLTPSTFDPDYKVVSILYSPPGNQSGQGYGTSTTNGTVTTITSSFTFSSELTFSSGSEDLGIGGSASIGYSTTSNNSNAFTQTWTDATTIVSDDNSNLTYNPTKSDAVNHNLDEFVIWLNPQVTVYESGTTPVSYTTGSQPTAGVSAIVIDTVTLPAVAMEATPPGATGVTTVPVGYLIPQAIAGEDGVNSYMPGLAAICKNSTLYQEQLAADLANPTNPTAICTQTNQCGCVPSDFVAILQTDPLLNYNGTTLTASPDAGTVDPLTLDGSGISICGQNPVPTPTPPTVYDCRYAIVPIATGSTTPLILTLSGDTSPTETVTDLTSTTTTVGHTIGHSVGLSFGGGALIAKLVTMDTWTWTDGETWGKVNGTTNSMQVTLRTSNADCVENVNIYEDTEFHTFAFQVPTGITTCP